VFTHSIRELLINRVIKGFQVLLSKALHPSVITDNLLRLPIQYHRMEEKVTLNKKEQKRLMVFNLVEKGKMEGVEAAAVLEPSLRHTKRPLGSLPEETCGWFRTWQS